MITPCLDHMIIFATHFNAHATSFPFDAGFAKDSLSHLHLRDSRLPPKGIKSEVR